MKRYIHIINFVTAKHDVIFDSQLPHGMTGEKLKELEKGHVTEPGPESPTPKEPPKFITQVRWQYR